MANLDEFLVERLRDFDPTLDTSSGSLVRRTVIDPTVTRFGTEVFAIDIREFINERLKQEFPSVDTQRTAVDDLLVKPLALILDPIRREIQAIGIQQSLEDPTLLSEAEADALVANILISRIEGNRSRGVARLFYNAAIDFTALPTQTILNSEGTRFHPTQLQTIVATEMEANTDGSFKFFDVTVEAEEEGDSGDIAAGTLTRIEGAPAVVKVTNILKFSGGVNRQTNAELKQFAEQNVTERSLTTEKGLISQIQANFNIEDVEVVGYGDPEMDRDLIESIGDVLESNTAAATATVASGILTDSAKDFVAADVRVGDNVFFVSGPNAGQSFTVAVVAPGSDVTKLDLTGPPTPLPDGGGSLTYLVTQRTIGTLTISNIPGGILSDPPVSVPNNQIHVGNHTDVYVKPGSIEEDFADISSLPDPTDDKDSGDTAHIDVDLISYTKAEGAGTVTSGSKTLTTTEPLRKFGLAVNDIIRFSSPASMAALGDLIVDVITDGPTVSLDLVDSDGVDMSAPVTDSDAQFTLLSTGQGIQSDQLPLVRVTTINILSAQGEPISGLDIPLRNSVDAKTTAFFSSGASAPAQGKIRLYFLEPTTYQVDPDDGTDFKTIFLVQDGNTTLYYQPDAAATLGDLGDGVRKVRDPDLGNPSNPDSGVGTGEFNTADNFDVSGDTITADPGDLIVVKNSVGTVIGNFYATASVVAALSVPITPSFDGALPTTGLDWFVVAEADVGSQRIRTEDMAANKEGSLFFVDIAAKSYDFNTTGADPRVVASADDVDDLFNLSADTQASVFGGDRSFGYFFKQNINPGFIRDEELAFSIRERLILSLTDRILARNTPDPILETGKAATFLAFTDPNNRTTGLEDVDIRVNFDKAPVIQGVQTFVDDGTGRVVTENILIKHMIPAFVDLVIDYVAGSSALIAQELIENLIDETDSNENLSASDIDFVMRQNVGASDMTMPLGLVSVVHNEDRTITVERSEDALVVTRLSHFFVGDLTLTRL